MYEHMVPGMTPRDLADVKERQASQVQRCFVPAEGFAPGEPVQLPADAVKHMHTLRTQPGAALELVNGRGALALGTVASISRKQAVVTVDSASEHAWAGPRIVLAVAGATLKGSRSDWLIEKASELGAFAFVPLLSERSPELPGAPAMRLQDNQLREDDVLAQLLDSNVVSAGAGEASGRFARWQRVAAAATEQCLRVHGMRLCAPMQVSDAAACARAGAAAFVAAEGGPPVLASLQEHLLQVASSAAVQPSTASAQHVVLLLVGPEGDFTVDELQQLTEAGAHIVGLGDARLRTETAALALLSAASLSVNAR